MLADSPPSAAHPARKFPQFAAVAAPKRSPGAPPMKLLWREGASLAYIKLTASLAKAVPLGVHGGGQKIVV